MSNVVTFDSVDLSAITGVDIYNYEFNYYPSRELKSYKLANQNRSALTSAEYVDKEILVQAIVRDCERESAEAVMMELRAKTQGFKKSLVVEQYLTTVSYIATLRSLNFKWVGNNLMIEMTFYCDEPIGTDTTQSTLVAVIDENTTTSPKNWAVTFAGSAIEQYPTIQFTINSLTLGTEPNYIKVSNSTNSHEMIIYSEFVANDEIVIDCYEKTVSINGTITDYTGRIPEWNVGATNITYEDSFSARNVDISATYYKRYV